MVCPPGLGPGTHRLKVDCSTTELRALAAYLRTNYTRWGGERSIRPETEATPLRTSLDSMAQTCYSIFRRIIEALKERVGTLEGTERPGLVEPATESLPKIVPEPPGRT